MGTLQKLSDLKPRVTGKAQGKKAPAGMNKLERRYADHLEMLRSTHSDIERWDYEPEKLRLAEGAWYTPDFRIIFKDGTVEFHETKGFMREAAHVRLKVAADQHPYIFRLVRWVNKQWEIHTL